jgi:hypothetical protein
MPVAAPASPAATARVLLLSAALVFLRDHVTIQIPETAFASLRYDDVFGSRGHARGLLCAFSAAAASTLGFSATRSVPVVALHGVRGAAVVC